jgi:hypothetical protein
LSQSLYKLIQTGPKSTSSGWKLETTPKKEYEPSAMIKKYGILMGRCMELV